MVLRIDENKIEGAIRNSRSTFSRCLAQHARPAPKWMQSRQRFAVIILVHRIGHIISWFNILAGVEVHPWVDTEQRLTLPITKQVLGKMAPLDADLSALANQAGAIQIKEEHRPASQGSNSARVKAAQNRKTNPVNDSLHHVVTRHSRKCALTGTGQIPHRPSGEH